MNEAVQRGLDYLKKHRGEAFSVREIEEEVGLNLNTLASPFNRLVKRGEGGIERADASYPGTKRVYQGFKYVGD
jgi:hypothetical protein